MKKYITAVTGCLLILLTTIAPWMSAAAVPNNIFFRNSQELHAIDPSIPDLTNPRYVLYDLLSFLGLSDDESKSHLYIVYRENLSSPDIWIKVYELNRTNYSYIDSNSGARTLDYVKRYNEYIKFSVIDGEFRHVSGSDLAVTDAPNRQLFCRLTDGKTSASGWVSGPEIYTYFMFCDNAGFVFPDECEHKSQYDPEEEELNVTVSVNPELSGEFSTVITDISNDPNGHHRGNTTRYENFRIDVTNNNSYPVQFSFYIHTPEDNFSIESNVAGDLTTSAVKTYSGNPLFTLLTDEWTYLPTKRDLYNDGVKKVYGPTVWHYLQPGESKYYLVKFSQINFSKYGNYLSQMPFHVEAYAIRNDLDLTSNVSVNRFGSNAYNIRDRYLMDFTQSEKVYSKIFHMMDKVEFDNSKVAGVYAFDPDDELIFRKSLGYVDSNGQEVIDNIDNLLDVSYSLDPQYNWTQNVPRDEVNAWSLGSSTVNASTSGLINTSKSFLQFVNQLLDYFPPNVKAVFVFGFTGLIVIGIIKVVIK